MVDTFTYSSLKDTYDSFEKPMVVIEVDGSDVADSKAGLGISDVEVNLSCGFEAASCKFSIYNCYDRLNTCFDYDAIKDYITLGAIVIVYLGYGNNVREVFRGLVTRVEFVLEEGDIPHVDVIGMDVKSIMMANRYHKRLISKNYSGALKEIFAQDIYMNLIGPGNLITALTIKDTPDATSVDTDASLETDETIEMIGESDYEFFVRTAKRFDYEFFCIGGQLLFRQARCDSTSLISLSNDTKIFNMNIAYDVTGLTGGVRVRGLDAGSGKVLENSISHSFKISAKAKAKGLINGAEYVYIDPTVTSKSEAQNRAFYLFNNMSYRFGTLDMELVGLPELIPGRFIDLVDYGTIASNTFYLTEVKHSMSPDGKFSTRVIGKAQELTLNLI